MSENRSQSLSAYARFLAGAFDELHSAVLERVSDPGQYFRPHHDYPRIRYYDNGLPYFTEAGLYDKEAPTDYVGVYRPRGLLAAFPYDRPAKDFPIGADLVAFLKSNPIGERFEVLGDISDYLVNQIIGECVERYLHLYGTGALDKKRRREILKLVFFGTTKKNLNMRLVVPIALTHFDVGHFQLDQSTYLARLSKPLQLSRSQITRGGSGADSYVVGAATHAFVSTGWSVPNETIVGTRIALSQSPTEALGVIDRFFGCLRAATGIATGYAQLLFIPSKWATGFFCDLPPVFGATVRRYPNSFDRYAWSNAGLARVTKTNLIEIKRIYGMILQQTEERISIAIKRLNACMTRDDDVDAILDATIGLEVLLGDSDDNQALSYKLRMRAGALASLMRRRQSSSEVFKKMKAVYEARSAIVHGHIRKRSKKRLLAPEDPRYGSPRALATELLRSILEVLVENPRYLCPANIDKDLLLPSPLKRDESDGC